MKNREDITRKKYERVGKKLDAMTYWVWKWIY
jgi:hypothetical protein